MKKLEYDIYKCSSYTSVYIPENIKKDEKTDLSSRWSTDNNIPPQYIILKLASPSIVKTITFGKYKETHVCNVKKFKIFGGMKEENMLELLDGGLKNDNSYETFILRHSLGDHMIPIRYLKIVPLATWGPSFNFAIWYVELTGTDDPITLEECTRTFNNYRELEIVRLCLKHFREQNYLGALQALERDTNVLLEDPLLTEFFNILVQNADYEGAEKFLEDAVQNGLFSEYIANKEYQPVWERIDPQMSEELRPGMRGGHQMCIDASFGIIYLFGGWDGDKDLNDLWSYNIRKKKWTLLCADSLAVNGPSARSCHKMCLDTKRKQIFMLGRYVDLQFRNTDNLQSDFYMYDIEAELWFLITEDTSSIGGPQLIYDHQMCMDIEKRTLYVFGGRVLCQPSGQETSPTDVIYSGLFAYDVPINTWQQILVDSGMSTIANDPTVHSRVGHSMLFHPITRKLYIFAGQRNKEYINDFFTYQVDTRTVEYIYKKTDSQSGNIPAPGFTQRATIDPDCDEIFVLSGLSKEKEKREDIQNSIWVYKIPQNRWLCIYHSENSDEMYWKKAKRVEPCPRFAHQLVYDHINKIHYLFGGNPGKLVLPKLRLDDFWKLKLCKPTQSQLLQRCRLLIRKQKFEELTRVDSMMALTYLRTKLSDIIDHQNPNQIKEFHSMASLLFQEKQDTDCAMKSPGNKDNRHNEYTLPTDTNDTAHYHRSKLYEKLTAYFPEHMVQPKGNIVDLINL